MARNGKRRVPALAELLRADAVRAGSSFRKLT